MLIPNKHSGYQSGIRLYPGGGKGGSSAPPPDPRLVQAQIDSMGVQNDAIKEIMSNTRDMAPIQKQQMQFGLDTSRTAWDQSQADREYALERRGQLTGLQDRAIKDAADYNAEGYQEQLAQKAGEDVSAGMAQARGQSARAMAGRGISANSGAALALDADLSLGGAMQSAAATNMSRQAAKEMGWKLSDRASNMLAGYPNMGMSATGAGAGFGGLGLGYANTGLSGMNSGWNSAGGMGGSMGSNATGMYNAQSQYSLGNAKLAQSDSDPFGAMLGMAAGAAGTAFGGPLGGMAASAMFGAPKK
jgi:hypothetical protein